MKIEIIQCTGTKAIIEAMKVPRKRDNIAEVPKKIFSWGHWSLLEHCSMTVKISGISRACSHQLVRQRIGVTFTQESQRYVELDGDDWFVIPPAMRYSEIVLKNYIDEMNARKRLYEYFVSCGVDIEDARYILPNATKTTVVWTFNMNSLIWFLENRTIRTAQWEIRLLANMLYEKIMDELPDWAMFLEHWKQGSRR